MRELKIFSGRANPDLATRIWVWALACAMCTFSTFSKPEYVELFRLCADRDELRPRAAPPATGSRVTLVDLSLEPGEIARHGLFDLVVVSAGMEKVAGLDDLLPVLRKQMSKDGLLICLADAPDSFHDVILGCAIFYRLNPGSVVGNHSTDGCICSGIGRKEQTMSSCLTI